MNAFVPTFDDAALVREAAEFNDVILRFEKKWSGGNDKSARTAAARKYRLREQLLFDLQYQCRWPKVVGAASYLTLKHVAERLKALDGRLNAALDAALATELNIAKADGRDDTKAYCAAQAALGQLASEEAPEIDLRGRLP